MSRVRDPLFALCHRLIRVVVRRMQNLADEANAMQVVLNPEQSGDRSIPGRQARCGEVYPRGFLRRYRHTTHLLQSIPSSIGVARRSAAEDAVFPCISPGLTGRE